jgi:hypothetical protein
MAYRSRRHGGTRAALATGTALSVAAVAVWSWLADATTGPAPALHLGRDLPGDYAQLATAATGSPVALFSAVAVIYAACLTVSGLRRMRREAPEAREYERAVNDAEAAEHAAGWR